MVNKNANERPEPRVDMLHVDLNTNINVLAKSDGSLSVFNENLRIEITKDAVTAFKKNIFGKDKPVFKLQRQRNGNVFVYSGKRFSEYINLQVPKLETKEEAAQSLEEVIRTIRAEEEKLLSTDALSVSIWEPTMGMNTLSTLSLDREVKLLKSYLSLLRS
ncbi:MAG: hypothetical protein QXK65_02505 [Candidatus Micrarchaeaceae archaeon]